MKLFNRMVVILVFLAVSLAMILIALLPRPVVDLILTIVYPLNGTPLDRPVLTLSAIVIVTISMALVYLETRPEPSKGVKLAQIKGGVAELSVDSIAARIKQASEAVPDVRQITPSVVSHGKSVDVKISLIANPGVDISQKASEVVQVVRDLLENDIGIKVGKLRVNIKYDTRVA